MGPDQDGHPVGPDLGPNCLQKSSADTAHGQRVNLYAPPKICSRHFQSLVLFYESKA